MATVNKLVVLQKIKTGERTTLCVIFEKLTKKQKCEKWKEMTVLAQSHSMISL